VEEGAVRKALCLLAAAALLIGVLGVAQDMTSIEPRANLYLFDVPMDFDYTVMHLGLVFSEYVAFDVTDIFAIGGGVATLVAGYEGGGYTFVDIVAPPGSTIVVNVPPDSTATFIGAYVFP
jgi:hypothetical protein